MLYQPLIILLPLLFPILRPCQGGGGGGPRSLVGNLKCLVSAFCQGSRRCRKLSDIHLSLSVVCRYFIWALSLLFGPCRLSLVVYPGRASILRSRNSVEKACFSIDRGLAIDEKYGTALCCKIFGFDLQNRLKTFVPVFLVPGRTPGNIKKGVFAAYLSFWF